MSTQTLTVLFTDLVGSTELLVRVGEGRAEELRREHFSILRDAIGGAGGREVKSVGDGLMAVFDAPTAALDAAIELQRQIAYRNRRADEPFAIRVGVSAGEVDHDAGDFYGIAVVEASRLCDLAEGGQVLTAEVVRVLAGSRGSHQFTELGLFDLKGLDAPVAVWEVTWTAPAASELVGVPVPRRLERPTGAAFVGRGAERATLDDAFKEVVEGDRRHVLVAGEAGIGKTTLLSAFAAAVHEAGAIVLFGRCDEDLSIPYHPWREALHHLEEHRPDVLDGHRDALAPLLRVDAPELPDVESDVARYVLYNAVVESLDAVAHEAPVVVVLDDLHWADPQTIALARHLVLSANGRVMLLATFREADLEVDHPLTSVLAALHREPAVQRLRLRGLDDSELLDLMEALAGHELGRDGQDLRDELRAETDGNPFFATEILRHLAETGAIVQAPDGRWSAAADLRAHGLPVSVREVLGLRIGRLGGPTRRALQHAAVFGRDFDLELLARLLGEDVADVHASIVPAVDAGVVVDVAPNRFSFSHALIGHALYDELTPTLRARTHHDIARILEATVGEHPGARAGELAHHWSLATAPRDGRKAASFARQAGDFALAQVAPDDAAGWYERALDLLDSGDPSGRCELLVSLGEAQRQAGTPTFRETLIEACRLAVAHDLPDLLVRGAVANNRGSASEWGTTDDERVALLRAAIEVRPSTGDAALLHAILAAELFSLHLDEARRLAEEAISLARSSGQDRVLARVAILLAAPLRCPANVEMVRRLLDEAEHAAARCGDPSLGAYLAGARHAAALDVGLIDEADRYLARYVELSEQVPEPYFRWLAHLERSSRRLLAGEIGAAEELAQEALEIATAASQPNGFKAYAGQLFEIRRAQGRLDEIIDMLVEVVAATPGIPGYRAGLAVAFCDVDRRVEARRLLEPDIAAGFEDIPFDVAWATAMLFFAEAAAQVAGSDAGAALVERLQPWRGNFAYSNLTAGGSLARGLGLALAMCGRTDEAVDALEQALEGNRRLGAPILVAQTELDLARTIGARDRRRARQLASSAAATAARLGLGTIARRSDALLGELSTG